MRNDREKTVDERLEIAMEIFNDFNSMKVPIDKKALMKRARASLQQNSCIEFVQFACQEINAKCLSSVNPNEYIELRSTDRMSGADQRLAKLVQDLMKKADIPSFFNIILVDTDEDDYVFPIVGKPEGIDDVEISKRKNAYFLDFKERWKKGFGMFISKDCYKWSEIRYPNQIIVGGFDESWLKDEVERLKQIFSKGNYYDGWKNPTNDELLKIAKLKFKTYGNQGYQISRYFQNAILIQNEFPLELRTGMLNLLNDEDNKIPAIYPYGKSDSRY